MGCARDYGNEKCVGNLWVEVMAMVVCYDSSFGSGSASASGF